MESQKQKQELTTIFPRPDARLIGPRFAMIMAYLIGAGALFGACVIAGDEHVGNTTLERSVHSQLAWTAFGVGAMILLLATSLHVILWTALKLVKPTKRNEGDRDAV